MKRSEMIDLIKMQWNDSTSFPTDVAVANYILDAIEKAGMRPPSYWVNEGKDSFPPDGIPCMFIDWEPEDET